MRSSRLIAAVLAAAFAAPAAAQAADFYAAPGASGGPACDNPGAPCSLTAALGAARSAPGADVLHLSPGTFTEIIAATSEADSDVTIHGAGIYATTLAPPTDEGPGIQLGAAGTGSMALDNLTINGSASGMNSSALRSRLARLSLSAVRVVHNHGPLGKAVPAIDADAGSSELILDRVEVLADTQAPDPAIGAINVGGPLTIRDSRITHSATGDSAAIYARGDVLIQRSTIAHGEANAGYALRYSNAAEARSITIDSSLLTGGNTGARFDVGTLPTVVTMRGVTISPAVASNGYALHISPNASGSQAHATIASSLLLTRSVRVSNGAQATCTYTNLPATGSSGSPNCPTAAANAGGNSRFTTAELLLDRNLAPMVGSPAIDSGDPGGVAPGESPADRLGRPRAGSSADTCDAGAGPRDRGAFERYRPRPGVTINGPDKVTAGVAVTYSASVNAIDPAYSWSFGDETSTEAGPTASHVFAVGTSGVVLSVIDRAYDCSASASRSVTAVPPPPSAGANAPTGASAAKRDRTRPLITRAKLRSSRIKRRRNASLTFTLSESATVTITVSRKKGKRLVSARKIVTKRKRGNQRVTLSYRRLRLLTRRGARYRVRISARDSARNKSKTVGLWLRVR